MARSRTGGLRKAERNLYLTDRTLGDLLAFQRGGVAGLVKRLAPRQVRRKVGRASKGWL
ncbi:MAG TPA: hypothetical protein VFB06_11315 [Streptosporangiaceae bacterium]|nr:hypothetical protein [Streptosporangiaceae bacterium]